MKKNYSVKNFLIKTRSICYISFCFPNNKTHRENDQSKQDILVWIYTTCQTYFAKKKIYDIYNAAQIRATKTSPQSLHWNIYGYGGSVFLQQLLLKLFLLFRKEHVLTKADFVLPHPTLRDLVKPLQITERLYLCASLPAVTLNYMRRNSNLFFVAYNGNKRVAEKESLEMPLRMGELSRLGEKTSPGSRVIQRISEALPGTHPQD